MIQDLAIPVLECLRCGHRWIPRVPGPARCPKCQSRDWNQPKEPESDMEMQRRTR